MTLASGLMLLLLPVACRAHAFGQRYDLPLPLELYLAAAGFTVFVSFVIAVCFARGTGGRPGAGLEAGTTPVGRILQSTLVVGTARTLAVLLLVLIVATGLFGAQSPTRNFAPTFVWVIWWVGLTYAVALLGNVWDLVNPWRALYRGVSRLRPSLGTALFPYPLAMGRWPAFMLFIVFCYLEFVSDYGEEPRILAVLVLIYSAVMLAGMRLFGPDSWLDSAEVFTVLFGLLSRFGIFNGDLRARSLRLRFPASGLHNATPVSVSTMAFVLLMLTTVSFDGFLETPAWAAVVDYAGQSRTLRPALLALQDSGIDLLQFLKALALLVLYLAVLSVYLLVSTLMRRLSRGASTSDTARLYVLSLIPIALAYHLAHYFSYLLLAGQLIIPLSSDPFGYGWDLWGTADRVIDVTVVTARQVWYLSVAAIVIGHIAAVYLAHSTALRTVNGRRAAIVSQLPMLALMVGYTMLSLWILSQPIVSTG